MDEVAVVDASPLILLAGAGRLDLLRHVADRVIIPGAVEREILVRGPNDLTVCSLRERSWIEIVSPSSVPPRILVWDLGEGESAVLSAAAVTPGSIAVIDDLNARRCAASLKLRMIGTLGLVVRAKRLGVIASARPVLRELRESGLYLSDALFERAMREIGE